jgi:biotin synthase
MEKSDKTEAVTKLAEQQKLQRHEWRALLTLLDKNEQEQLRKQAVATAISRFGHGIYIRGLIEISSYCRNNCHYCGLRCSNKEACRYRLTREEILDTCRRGAEIGFNTFVLQGGEDPLQNDEWIAETVRAIHSLYPHKAITLSVGERSDEAYRTFRQAGATRYLLRHETRNEAHYSQLHPATMSGSNRRRCLDILKREGYQTGAGMMIGSPGQTTEHIIDDLEYLDELRPEMIGIGPFIPAAGTPFANEPAGSVTTTVNIISLLRLRHPDALIPATTALASLHPEGRRLAIQAGANVVMPNLTPATLRSKYSIYNNKASTGCESAEEIEKLEKELSSIGYHINYGKGDHKQTE